MASTKPEKYVRKKCEHDKYKYLCPLCGGSGLCEHGIRKIFCKECDGGAYCKHKKIKSNCIACDGSSLCPHDKRKDQCTECKISACICEHNLRKSRCVQCKGSEICPHNNNKHCCVECHGQNICEHNKLKYQCALCKGSKICPHEKRIHSCITCTPSSACQHCKIISIIGSRFKPYCFRCYCVLHPDVKLPHQFKLKEHYVRDALKAHFSDITMIFDKQIEGGCSKHRPDIFIDFGSHCVIIEIDENRHISYTCEEKRMAALYEDISFRKVVFLRFNPDGYTVGIQKYKSPFGYTPTGIIKINETEMARRIAELVVRINGCKEEPKEQIVCEYLFYG